MKIKFMALMKIFIISAASYATDLGWVIRFYPSLTSSEFEICGNKICEIVTSEGNDSCELSLFHRINLGTLRGSLPELVVQEIDSLECVVSIRKEGVLYYYPRRRRN